MPKTKSEHEYLVQINGKCGFVTPKNDNGEQLLEVDNVPKNKYFYPYSVKAVKDRLYRYPGYHKDSPFERQTQRTLYSFMKKAVVPKLNNTNAKKALYYYIHDSDIYKQFTAYAFGGIKKKPPGFDALQRVLHSKEFNNGSPTDLVLYRAINLQEMEASFDNFNIEDSNQPFFVNRNISTSVSPMVSLDFLNKKDPGIKCCLLVFRIPKGYPVIYILGLFSTSLVQDEREVFLPSGLYITEVNGICMTIDPKKIGMASKMGNKRVTMRVLVLHPYKRYSPFITGPKEVYKMDFFYFPGQPQSPAAKKVHRLLRIDAFFAAKTFKAKDYKPTGKKLGGSTGAQLVKDKRGKLFVWKRGANKEQAQIEFVANMLYKDAGVLVPVQYYSEQDGLLSEYVPGRELKDLNREQRAIVSKSICRWFLIDALLANWDVLGMDLDNILVPVINGKLVLDMPIRIDNGGSLTMRAQGSPKAFTKKVDELVSMRKKTHHKMFKELTDEDLKDQYRELDIYGSFGAILGRADYLLENNYITKGLRDTIHARVHYLGDHFADKLMAKDNLFPK